MLDSTTGCEGRADENDLARRIAAGDETALEAIYDGYGTIAFTLAVRIVGDRPLAEDIVQECFLNLWRSAGSFDPRRSNFRSWFFTIIRNRSFDKLRARAAQPKLSVDVEISDQAGSEDVAGDVVRALTAERVRQALKTLPGEQRETLELAYFAGLTQVEIAERMKVPLGTVKGRIRIAVAKLREQLAGLARDGFA